jgi:hypothetical protein
MTEHQAPAGSREDIVDRLRLVGASARDDLYPGLRVIHVTVAAEAADTIEALRSQLAEAREALKPFAEIANEYTDAEDDTFQVWRDFDVLGATLPLRNFRRARAVLSTPSGASNG